MSINDHIAPGTCNGCDCGRHYDGATGRAGCVCCRTVDEWVGIRAASAAGPVVSLPSYTYAAADGEALIWDTIRKAATKADGEVRVHYDGRLVAGTPAYEVLADYGAALTALAAAGAERDALSAVIDKVRTAVDDQYQEKWAAFAAASNDENDAVLRTPSRLNFAAMNASLDAKVAVETVLAAGGAAPVGETPTAPKCGHDDHVTLTNGGVMGQGAMDGSGWTPCPVGETPDEPVYDLGYLSLPAETQAAIESAVEQQR